MDSACIYPPNQQTAAVDRKVSKKSFGLGVQVEEGLSWLPLAYIMDHETSFRHRPPKAIFLPSQAHVWIRRFIGPGREGSSQIPLVGPPIGVSTMITRMDGLRSWRGGKLHVHAHVSISRLASSWLCVFDDEKGSEANTEGLMRYNGPEIS